MNQQESGCGGLSGWEWDQGTSTSSTHAYFYLPYIIKAGCVERAIVSAGGPKLSCSYQGTLDTLTLRRRFSQEEPAMEKKRAIKMEKVTMITPTPTQTMAALMKRNVTTDVPSLPSVTYQPNYTYSTSASSGITYVPMTWNTSDGGTVT